MKKPVVDIQELTKQIKGKKIIDDLNLQLYPGEVFGFLGPNGAGKTTTIRMMVGLMKPSKGQVMINGISLHADFEKAISQVGAIVENPELYGYLTGYKNLIHFARMHQGVTKQRISEVIEQVGLTNRIHEKVDTYSLGMRQRLGLAQALMHEPKFLILDEPTNGLDPAGIREFRYYLRKIAQEDQVSILVSSHLLSEIELMCDRVGIIQQGKLIDVRIVEEDRIHQEGEWKWEVDQPEQALEVITGYLEETDAKIKEGCLYLFIEKKQIPEINKKMVEAKIAVYGIESTRRTLEDQFLEITGGEQVV